MDYKFNKILERYQISVRNGMGVQAAMAKSIQELIDAEIRDRIYEFKRRVQQRRSYFPHQRPPSSLLQEWQKPDMLTENDISAFDANYSAFRHGGQQWAIPECAFESLREMGPIFEVFSSPLNRSRHSDMWGSMFEEDVAFGSVGPFQNVPLDMFKDRVVVLNPPYIEFMIEMMLNRLPEIRRVAKLVVICLPAWSDTKWYEEMTRTMLRFDLNAGTYVYHNSISNEPIIARFDSVLFTNSREAMDRITQPWMYLSHMIIFMTTPTTTSASAMTQTSHTSSAVQSTPTSSQFGHAQSSEGLGTKADTAKHGANDTLQHPTSSDEKDDNNIAAGGFGGNKMCDQQCASTPIVLSETVGISDRLSSWCRENDDMNSSLSSLPQSSSGRQASLPSTTFGSSRRGGGTSFTYYDDKKRSTTRYNNDSPMINAGKRDINGAWRQPRYGPDRRNDYDYRRSVRNANGIRSSTMCNRENTNNNGCCDHVSSLVQPVKSPLQSNMYAILADSIADDNDAVIINTTEENIHNLRKSNKIHVNSTDGNCIDDDNNNAIKQSVAVATSSSLTNTQLRDKPQAHNN